MEWSIWTGAAITLLGLAGLIYCIAATILARRAGLGEEALRTRLKAVLAWNMASLAVSALGLMAVVVGIFLA